MPAPEPAPAAAEPAVGSSFPAVAEFPSVSKPVLSAPQPDGRRGTNRSTIGKAAGGAAGGVGLIVKFWAGFKALVILLKFKTLLTMFISVAAYALFFGWKFAVGFVLLLFIHEMGHVVVLRLQGVKASAPMFIPFLGAFVTVKQPQRSVAAEATSALAGPAAGLLASGVVLFAADASNSAFLRALAYSGFLLNLFNLLPALPLDGGRVAGALHPAIWFAGIAGAVVLIFYFHSPVLIFVLILGIFEVVSRWRARRTGGSRAYFAIPRETRWAIGGAYALVAALCVAGMAAAYAPMSLHS
jgi:Zn-dependent protease